jgi:hypothetical protein
MENITNDRIGGWVVQHYGSNFTETFGPFKTLEEAKNWCDTIGYENRVRGVIIPLLSPTVDPKTIWEGINLRSIMS